MLQKEIEEFKQMKEDFAREKEEQLALYKENLDKTKQEEIERVRQEALKEQAKLEAMKEELEKEKEKEEPVNSEPIIQQTIIRDEEELNKLKYKNNTYFSWISCQHPFPQCESQPTSPP